MRGKEEKNIFSRRKLWIGCILLFFFVAVSFVGMTVWLIRDSFRLNSQLQREGYYMSEFEWKMMGCVYYLDKGEYQKFYQTLWQVHQQMVSRDSLMKVPKFSAAEEELEFYLALQNPRTGAFMDEAYPFCTYFSPTVNMIHHLEQVAKQAGKPLVLRYPLRFLDSLQGEGAVETYLNDLGYVGWVSRYLPKATYILAAEVVDYPDFAAAGYVFSETWKRGVLSWFYQNQDGESGYWGPRDRQSKKLINGGDLGATYHVLKLFISEKGEDVHPQFPLRYREALRKTTLERLAEPIPEISKLEKIHDWSLTRYQCVKLLSIWLWKDMTEQEKSQMRESIEQVLRWKLRYFYVSEEGAFSLYPHQPANLDGTGTDLSLLKTCGFWFGKEQGRLSAQKELKEYKVEKSQAFSEKELSWMLCGKQINSLRLYRGDPTHYDGDGLLAVSYVNADALLDGMELLPRLRYWVDNTPQTMGNWVSKARSQEELAGINWPIPPVLSQSELLQKAREINGGVTVVGMDIWQAPICLIRWEGNIQ